MAKRILPIFKGEVRKRPYEKRNFTDLWWKKAYEILYQARHRSREKGTPFDLDIDWIYERLIKGCEVTGLKFELHHSTKQSLSPSIDRINNNLSYTKDNCRLVI